MTGRRETLELVNRGISDFMNIGFGIAQYIVCSADTYNQYLKPDKVICGLKVLLYAPTPLGVIYLVPRKIGEKIIAHNNNSEIAD